MQEDLNQSSSQFIEFQQNKIVSHYLKQYNQDLEFLESCKNVEPIQEEQSSSQEQIDSNNLILDIEDQDDFYPKNFVRGPNYSTGEIKTFITNCQQDVIYAQEQLKGFQYSLDQQQKRLVQVANSSGKDNKILNNKKLLLLSLEGTLIYKCRDMQKEEPDFFINMTNNINGETMQVGIKKRPYLLKFLNQMNKHYKIVVFSQQKEKFIELVLKKLDPSKKFITGYLSQHNCLKTNKGYYIKDLRIIQNFQLKDMVILDSQIQQFAYQLDNGVPIMQFQGSMHDQELFYVQKYLIDIAGQNDVREYNRENLKLQELGKMKLQNIKF